MDIKLIFHVCGLISLTFRCDAATVAETNKLLTDLMNGYNKVIRPVLAHTDAVNVSLLMYPRSIKEFDEVKETFSYTTGLSMMWNDFRLSWNVSSYGGLTEITMPITNVWTPEVFLASPATTKMYILESWNQVRVDYSGNVFLIQAMMIESTCSLNVRHYPFDRQSCDTLFMSLVYRSYEVALQKSANGLDLALYSENAQWDITSTNVYAENIPIGNETQMHFIFNLKRKSEYVFLNVLLPILTLNLLNTMVFLLVPESGERIGYCITTLLAIAVYMTIIMNTLPQSSSPVPVISYKLVIDLIFSALIIVVVIINMRLRGKSGEEPVPKWLVVVHSVLTCRRCRGRTVKPEEGGHAELPPAEKMIVLGNGEKLGLQKSDFHKMDGDKKTEKEPTWQDISSVVDTCGFIFFFVYGILSFVVFTVVTSG